MKFKTIKKTKLIQIDSKTTENNQKYGYF